MTVHPFTIEVPFTSRALISGALHHAVESTVDDIDRHERFVEIDEAEWVIDADEDTPNFSPLDLAEPVTLQNDKAALYVRHDVFLAATTFLAEQVQALVRAQRELAAEHADDSARHATTLLQVMQEQQKNQDFFNLLRRFANGLDLRGDQALTLEMVADEAAEALADENYQCCPIDGVACFEHGYVHGEEAEDFRREIRHLIDKSEDVLGTRVVTVDDLEALLEEIDARDSLAYHEATRTMLRTTPTPEGADAPIPFEDETP